MEQMIERKLSWIERLRKRIYLRFMKADSIKRFHNLPHFLKYDREVIEQLFSKCREKGEDIIGKVVIIHDMPDDFTTQPSGNSGNKIACGKIE